MGTVLEKLTSTGDWSAEVRSESAFIYGPTLARKQPPGLAVRTEEVPQFVATLNQILSHIAYPAGAGGSRARYEWTPTESRTGFVSFDGPVIAYGDNPSEWEHRAIELRYEDVQALRDALA